MIHTEKTPLFRGAATALATPFSDGNIDYPALGRMVEYQIAAGIDALVFCGTTGEAATLTATEYAALCRFAVETVRGRVPVLIGCGTNDTAAACDRARTAATAGADGLLVVTPYYNKGTREGLIRHFTAVADAGELPLILYHVPGRTGVRLSCADLLRLSEHPLVVGIKEASGDIELFADLCAAGGAAPALYTGCDSQILPSLSLGGAGVISVLSNLFPRETGEICRLFFAGRADDSRTLFLRYLPLMRLLFAETNPAPLKCALAHAGQCREEMRLPLYPVPRALRERLHREMETLSQEGS